MFSGRNTVQVGPHAVDRAYRALQLIVGY